MADAIKERAMPRWERALFGALLAVMGALFAYLFGYCCLFTSVFDTSSPITEHVLYLRDNVLVSLLMTLGGALLLRLMLRWEARIDLRWLTAAALLVTFALGCAWALVLRAQPVNDPGIMHYTAAELTRGHVEELARHETYLRAYPFQAGYIQYEEMLQRVFGRGATLPQQLLNAAYITITYGTVMDMVWRSLRDRRVQIVTTLLLLTALQPVLYVTMHYGNVPGLCFAALSLWALMRWVQGGRALWLLPALALITVAVALKPNYLIVALAMALVCAMYAFGAKRYAALAVALALMACPLLGSKASQMLLEKRTGFVLGEGAPQTTWLAMGMQEGPMASGWYNRYTLDTIEAADGDRQRMAERNRETIAARLKQFADDPGYAVTFFHQKMVSQWAETTFEALLSNRSMPNESLAPQVTNDLLSGQGAQGLARYMEGWTLLVYLGLALGCIGWAARLFGRGAMDWHGSFAILVLQVTVFGGFLYHMLFEAKSLYLVTYLPLMAPMAAQGLSLRLRKPPAP